MSFDASKFQIMPLDKANLAGFIQIAEILEEAPHWSLDAYLGLINRDPSVPRISLVAQDVQAGEVIGFVVACLIPPVWPSTDPSDSFRLATAPAITLIPLRMRSL